MIQNTWLLWGIVFAMAAFSIWFGTSTKVGKFLGFINVGILSGLVLVNIGLVPLSNTVYDTVSNYFVPVGIVLMLFMCDLRKLGKCGPKMVIMMIISIVIMIVGGILAGVLFSHSEDSWMVWGMATANMTGNMQTGIGVGSSFGISGADLTMYCAAFTFPWILYSMLCYMVNKSPIPKVFRSYKDSESGITITKEEQAQALLKLQSKEAKIHVNETAIVLGAAVAICGVGNWLGEVTGIYSIIFYATIGILVANFTPIHKCVVNDYLANLIFVMYMFTVGCTAHWTTFMGMQWKILAGVIFSFLFSIVVYMIICKLFRLPWEYMLITHMACVGGPIATPPLTKFYGWTDLVLPGVIVAVLGNVIGSYAGVFVGTFLRGLVGG